MVSDELVSFLLGELVEGVEGASKVASVGLESLADLLDDAVSLLVGEAGAERELSEVAANTDTGGDNHGLLVSGQRRAVKLGGVHV